MSFLLSRLRQLSISPSEIRVAVPRTTMWLGRMMSTRPSNCSEKCEKFNPKRPCCRSDNGIDDDMMFNPLFDWHPFNVFHPLTHKRVTLPAPKPQLKIDHDDDCDGGDDD